MVAKLKLKGIDGRAPPGISNFSKSKKKFPGGALPCNIIQAYGLL